MSRTKGFVAAAALAAACGTSDKPRVDTAGPAIPASAIDTVSHDSASASSDESDAAPRDSSPATAAEIAAARTPAVIALESFNFARQRLDSAAIYALSLDENRLLRGLVFGRHGRRFVDDKLVQGYLATMPWYKSDRKFSNSRLNDVERANLDLIRGAEASHHEHIEPGDVRYYRGRAVNATMLGHHTPKEWKMLASEVLAINGHAFQDLPDDLDPFAPDSSESLQLYYDNRYWYKAVKPLKYTDLSAADRELADSIEVARIKDLDSFVGFGMMRLFQRTPLSEKNVTGNNVMTLRLMRNEIYAVHGRDFQTPWLRRMLAAEGYQPSGSFREADLTDIERENIALITRVEARRHEELSTAEIYGQQFVGMPLAFVRLLRNEIYARHGRVFKDRTLQAYFAGQPWYRPNPAFDESLLTAREKENARIILEHERLIARGGGYPEG